MKIKVRYTTLSNVKRFFGCMGGKTGRLKEFVKCPVDAPRKMRKFKIGNGGKDGNFAKRLRHGDTRNGLLALEASKLDGNEL